MVSYISSKHEEEELACPWCWTKLEASKHDVLTHLRHSAKDLQQLFTKATTHLIYLQALPGLLRVRFLQYVEAWFWHRSDRSSFAKWMKMEALEMEFRRACRRPFHRYNLIAHHLLGHLSETYGLIQWFTYLVDKQDIMTCPNLVIAPMRYGIRRHMFKPLVTEAMKE